MDGASMGMYSCAAAHHGQNAWNASCMISHMNADCTSRKLCSSWLAVFTSDHTHTHTHTHTRAHARTHTHRALLTRLQHSPVSPYLRQQTECIRERNRPVKIEWWGVGVVICLERGADCLHLVQLMPLHSKTPSSLASFKSRLVLPFWYQSHHELIC